MKVKLFFLVWFSSLQSLGVEMTAPETRQIVSSLTQETIQNADAIWHFAELGYRESESSAQLANYLEKGGYPVTRACSLKKQKFHPPFSRFHPAPEWSSANPVNL